MAVHQCANFSKTNTNQHPVVKDRASRPPIVFIRALTSSARHKQQPILELVFIFIIYIIIQPCNTYAFYYKRVKTLNLYLKKQQHNTTSDPRWKNKNRLHVTNPGTKFIAATMAPFTDRYSHCQRFHRIMFMFSRRRKKRSVNI